MKLPLLPLLVCAMFSAPALADPALAQKKNCMACHKIEKKVVGPAFNDVAKKYAGQDAATALLADKVVKGGKGAWGAIPMPANPQVSPAEAQTLVKWILSLK